MKMEMEQMLEQMMAKCWPRWTPSKPKRMPRWTTTKIGWTPFEKKFDVDKWKCLEGRDDGLPRKDGGTSEMQGANLSGHAT
jgi:hypothetical protein